MGEVVSLKLHKNTYQKRMRKTTSQTLVATAKQIKRHIPLDGYVLVGFSIASNGTISHHVHFDVPSASITYILPYMAQQAITAAIAETDGNNDR
ncbi:MAG: hypothetical protein VYC35_02840 [Pseudomonadota bacterium]|nr:hypothetical protein [Pseudomonadota bacterium]